MTTIPGNDTHTDRTPFGARVLDWIVRISEPPKNAFAARKFNALNQLSDAELAAQGLERAELMEHCFGFLRRG